MFNVILYQPEIPPNTGNIIRLCANTGTPLHLIEPLGFDLDAARLRRAGLDYHELTSVIVHRDWDAFAEDNPDMALWAFSTQADRRFDTARFAPGDGLLFGPESRGLPAEVFSLLGSERVLRIPMHESSRSMNLSNSVAVALYEALRQHRYAGLG